MAEFLPIDPHADNGWDDFVSASPDGWVWGLSGWQRMIERVDEWGLRPLSFEMRENGRRVAIMPLHLNRAGIAASSGWGWVGPMLAGGLTEHERQGALKRVMAHAESLATNTNAQILALGSMPITRRNLDDKAGVNPFFELGYEDRSTNSKIIDLTQSDDALRQGLSEFARRQIRKSERSGWRVERVDWQEHVQSYYELHVETYQRTGVQAHPSTYFSGIAREMAPHGHAALFAGRNKNGTVCAYVNIGRFGNASYYHTGCSNVDALQEGGNYLTMWSAILDAKSRGHRWFDIGEVFFDVNHGKQRGLTDFKTKFGGSLRRYYKAQKKLVDTAHAPAESEQASPSNWWGSVIRRFSSPRRN